MSNFHIKEFNGFNKPMPDVRDPEVKERTSSISLKDYRVMAKKCIKSLSPKLGIPQFKIKEMLNSEDYIGDVVFRLAVADWTYDKTNKKTPRSWRNQQVIYYLESLPGVSKTKKNRKLESLDKELINSENRSICLYDLKDSLTINPFAVANQSERRKRLRDYINMLLRNTLLTDKQRQVVYLKYFGGPDGQGIDSLKKIGETLNPPVSRQDVSQLLDRGIKKLRQTAFGTMP